VDEPNDLSTFTAPPTSWWVTPEAFDRGYYTKLYHALRQWVTEDFPFRRPYYSNAEVPSQDPPGASEAG
jgi:hypothetical protein